MPCLARPPLPLPALPVPLSVTPPPLPPIPAEPQFCCTLPPIPTPPPIPPIPPIPFMGVIAKALDNAVDQVLGYLDKIPLKCPKEL